MAVYAIGDLQGCYNEFMVLLDQIDFSPGRDKLWLVGDLVNRGPDSLKCLRFVKDLGNRAVVVLGNHDLHLLALSQGNLSKKEKDHTLDPVLQAPDRDELLDWLRHRPLMHCDQQRDIAMIHAGLAPEWDIPAALGYAGEVEAVLRSDDFPEFCRQMYGNKPNRWSEQLDGMERYRFITNSLTRLRYCRNDGTLALKEKGTPGTQSSFCIPWFKMPGRASRNARILFGHWSTLGYHQSDNIWALDSGCLWGGKLTAVRIRKTKAPVPYQIDCKGVLKP
ncbi:MAG: symmetrical bis(5'-nucleosyl)-tetraphosphatase [Gammaproteobacteria bacterium]|nr:symmetrical bis(5'-nucleosyl)-tetraphosphatase [Gammaproteobacteria bacterium]